MEYGNKNMTVYYYGLIVIIINTDSGQLAIYKEVWLINILKYIWRTHFKDPISSPLHYYSYVDKCIINLSSGILFINPKGNYLIDNEVGLISLKV